MGRINGQGEAVDSSEIFSINNEEKSLLLYNVPIFLAKHLITDIFERFGTIREVGC